MRFVSLVTLGADPAGFTRMATAPPMLISRWSSAQGPVYALQNAVTGQVIAAGPLPGPPPTTTSPALLSNLAVVWGDDAFVLPAGTTADPRTEDSQVPGQTRIVDLHHSGFVTLSIFYPVVYGTAGTDRVAIDVTTGHQVSGHLALLPADFSTESQGLFVVGSSVVAVATRT